MQERLGGQGVYGTHATHATHGTHGTHGTYGTYGIAARLALALAALVTLAASAARTGAAPAPPVSLASLLVEMTDPAAVARFPDPLYRSLQASSYNRESVQRGGPGWFADSDGLGYLREETRNGRKEWVILEHTGPGCLTRLWTPYFYYDLGDHRGPNLRIYLDDAPEPVIDESFIELVTGRGSVKPPFATLTARAGDLYLPIPFARSCRVTLAAKPFYHLVNYRAYPPGTAVETFTRERFAAAASQLEEAGRNLRAPPAAPPAGTRAAQSQARVIGPRSSMRLALSDGPGAVRQLELQVAGAVSDPAILRSTVLSFSFDGERTVWCPLGDFFGCADALHPFDTWQRTVTSNGVFICRWVMPYEKSASLRVLNLGNRAVEVHLQAALQRWTWDERSLHFHANWRPDDVVPGTPFQDWNYIDITGRGVFVGDAWTVLNLQRATWWGEGDEKIYVDGAWEAGFPTHFGTGTEDYYGWAGGVLPTRDDEFDEPFLANIRVGGLDGHTQGFNICTRTRSLDAIPFTRRFRFDMESSFGTDIRNPWNLLGYSAVTFWYAAPGAHDNRPPQSRAASVPILSLDELQRQSDVIRQRVGTPAK